MTPNAPPELYGTTTVGGRGQVVIPQAARERLSIQGGDRLVVLGLPGVEDGLLLMKSGAVNDMLSEAMSKLSAFQQLLGQLDKDSPPRSS